MRMKKITSFSIDHIKLLRGTYVSRKDLIGSETITTFDIRMKEPNREPVLDVPAIHTVEHLGATFLRNHEEWGKRTIYFGPMGCRTGFYVLFHGDYSPEDIIPLMREMFEFIVNYREDIPGASAAECGNYLSHDLEMARYEARIFLDEVMHNLKTENLVYPGGALM